MFHKLVICYVFMLVWANIAKVHRRNTTKLK